MISLYSGLLRYLVGTGDLDGIYGYLKDLDLLEKYYANNELFKPCIY